MKYVYKTIPTHPQFEICDEETLDRCIRTVDTKEYLKVYMDKYGYPFVYLCKKYGGTGKFYKIHRLIAEAYIGKIPEGMEIDHINRDRKLYVHTNLRIVSHKENLNNPLTIEYKSEVQKIAQKTAHNHQKKIVLQLDIDTGEILNEYIGVREAGLQTGIYPQNISACCKGKYKTAGGYVWRFKD